MTLTGDEFAEVAALARREAGLELGAGKEQLVAARLSGKVRELKLGSFHEYCRHVRSDPSGAALLGLIDALTTNHTAFFREPAHFDFLRARILPERPGGLRIWCAAASTGEEPYSIALTVRENAGAAGAPAWILATDISPRVLAVARRGMYRAERLEGEPAPWLRKHLLRGEGRSEGWLRMRPEVRAMVEFRRLNLIEPLPAALPRFAAIFCRNVMIYFSRATQEAVVSRLAERLEPGGYLIVGHAESLSGIRHELEPVQPSVYQRPGGGGGR